MEFLLKEEKEELHTTYNVFKKIINRDYKTLIIKAFLIFGSIIPALRSPVENLMVQFNDKQSY
jgi:hypothetical protein